ncbi:MAG TPA: S8 family serine peptidase [Solirubrobacterales bacterium]|nr:S8 family serine peptidase [Solirubrobacterales bacterium]
MRSLAAALFSLALIPAGARAAFPEGKAAGPLSPALEELAEPALATRPPDVQADRLGLPSSGPGSLVQERGEVLVTARFGRGAIAAFEQLRSAGARIVSADGQIQTLTLAAAPQDLPAIAAVPDLEALWPVREPVVYATGSCEGGSAISEGLAQLRVDQARQAFELRGKGLTVGVLSDSYDTAKEGFEPPATDARDDEASNDLPGPAASCSGQQLPVRVLDEGPSGEGDEGRAMLQIVHDLAPHASLAFATAFESEESFAQNIEALARPVAAGGAGADVIVDDVAWFEEPFFQDGPVAVAINRVTADGVSYLSATGNDNLFDSSGNEIASWEAPAFRDSGGCPAAIAAQPEFNGTHCMDFNPGAGTDRTFGITVAAGETLTVDLQWAEPWNGVATDLDAFLLSGPGLPLAAAVEDNTGGTQRPVEILQWENESASAQTVQLAINRFAGATPRLKFILLQNGGGVTATEYPKSSGGDVVGPAVYGHAGGAGAISVAAVPFNSSAQIEPYSSRGPVLHLFGPVEGAAPAAPLGSPEVIAKPDLAATDCGATTFFSFLSGGTWRFCGTSAAAPHAAAVAALLRQAQPSLGEEGVREVLTETAAPVGGFPAAAAGAGLVDAFAAIASLPGPIAGGDGPSGPVPPIEPSSRGTFQVAMPPPVGPTVSPPAQPPTTKILVRPPKLVRTRGAGARVAFRFGSDQADATFLCKLDRRPYRLCPSRFLRRYAVGRHTLRVRARSASGLLDPTPAFFRFRVEAAG